MVSQGSNLLPLGYTVDLIAFTEAHQGGGTGDMCVCALERAFKHVVSLSNIGLVTLVCASSIAIESAYTDCMPAHCVLKVSGSR